MATARRRRRRPNPFRVFTRDRVLYIVGIAGIVNEGFVHPANAQNHQSLLVLYGAMVGLPTLIRGVELHLRRFDDDGTDDDRPTNGRDDRSGGESREGRPMSLRSLGVQAVTA